MEFFFKQLMTKVGSLLLPLAFFVPQSAPIQPNPSPTPLLVESFPLPSPQVIILTLPPSPPPSPLPSPKPTLLPIPKPTPVIYTPQQLDDWFSAYSNSYSVNRQKLWLIAVCESQLNPNAKNGDYGGLYQFSSSTWKSTRIAMNQNPDPNLRFLPEEAIKTAAFKIAVGGLSSWPNCSK